MEVSGERKINQNYLQPPPLHLSLNPPSSTVVPAHFVSVISMVHLDCHVGLFFFFLIIAVMIDWRCLPWSHLWESSD